MFVHGSFCTRKILFPVEEHYVDFEDSYKFEINNVYVNCPRRYHGDYQNIKNLNDNTDFKSIEVSGNNWGMCTNEFIFDLHRFLSDKDLASVSMKNLRKRNQRDKDTTRLLVIYYFNLALQKLN